MLGRTIELVPDGTTIMIATALGQRPYDPVEEIHQPVVRLKNAERLFQLVGLEAIHVFHQMNPDLTINFATSDLAAGAAETLRALYVDEAGPIFHVEQSRRQLFVELEVPPALQHNRDLVIRHRGVNDFLERADDYIWQSPTNEQSTAHHSGEGILLAWRKGGKISSSVTDMAVTDIAPSILHIFGLPPQPWQRPRHDGVWRFV